ncbi:MAG: hypothetical protein IKJ65_06505 [Clostridia bacterium]|nr:hypothetical protein [Clostridia bacterium]
MKHMKWLIVLIAVMLLVGIPLTASALDAGLETEPVSEEEMAELIARKANKFTKFTSYSSPRVIKCFDVREDHMIVVGSMKDATTAIIAVYDRDGVFQYGFETEIYGSFRVMWSGNDIVFYAIRSSLLLKINEDGKITDIRRVLSTTGKSVYDQKVLLSKKREVDGVTYRMTNGSVFADLLRGSLKKITRTDAQGTSVVYDASGHQRLRIVNVAVVAVLAPAFIAVCVVANVKKMRAQRKMR